MTGMKRLFILPLLALAMAPVAAQQTVVCDFEDMALGDTLPMSDLYNGYDTDSRAEVVADPANPQNKVLHVTNKSWNTLIEIDLGPLASENITETYRQLAFDLYRPASDGAYKQFVARLGADTIYADAGFYDQGQAEAWVPKAYFMSRADGPADKLYMGFNSEDADFYVDNIRLVAVDYGYDFTDPEQTLRHHAALAGKNIGVAVPVWRIDVGNDNLEATQTVFRNFNMVVAENEMKPDAIQPSRGQFNFGDGDRLCDFAERHGMAVRGHTLVWHNQAPAWITADGYKNDHNYTRAELLEIMREHITSVVGHYKGRVSEWDVVNEVLDDDQSIIRTNPAGYKLRESVWQKVIGDDYIDSAFVYAHRADPDARLYINDYGVEFQGKAKTQAYYNLVRRLLNDGLPVGGVGFQCHLTVGEADSAKFSSNVKRYGALGVKCAITELDMSMPDPYAAGAEEQQAEEYAKMAKVMMNYGHCESVVVWGVTDDMSWRQGNPLLFRSTLEAKPAFFALRDVLKEAAENVASGIGAAVVQGEGSPFVDVYDLSGRPVAKGMLRSRVADLPRGIYIVGGKCVVVK